MLKLNNRSMESLGLEVTAERKIARVTINPLTPEALRPLHVLLVEDPNQEIPTGFSGYLIPERFSIDEADRRISGLTNAFRLPEFQNFLSDGDVVRLRPQQGAMTVLYRKNANYNALLVTERCNNYCLMCSQPPKDFDDSYIVNELLETIPLMDRETREIGITGGEPTLLGAELIRLLRTAKGYLPDTAIHVLSNGRNFKNLSYVKSVAGLQHPDLMFGIPIYSDISNIHDYVVQADGAFDETIRGILNLKRFKQKVEVRVVIHKQTYERLPQLAEFLGRNLLFVDHVALMGLEMMGFTRHNLDELWIDPVDYQAELREAVKILQRYRMRVSIYNHQLCVLDRALWGVSRKSISDWKNEYMPECQGCSMKESCGGFFSSARLRYSKGITPFVTSVGGVDEKN